MKRTSLSIIATALLWHGAPAQVRQGNWIEVAQALGGSGRSSDGRYVVLLPCDGWGRSVTPHAWLEFRAKGGGVHVRGTVPLRANRVDAVVKALEEALPAGAGIDARDHFGRRDPRKQVRFEAGGRDVPLAVRLRAFFEWLQPDLVGRVAGTGTVRKDTFECEDSWAIVTPPGEVIVVDALPDDLRREGLRVSFAARRRDARSGQFLYFGSLECWRSVARLETAAPAKEAAGAAGPSLLPPAAWADACERHARALLAGRSHRAARRARALAGGFDGLRSPGFKVCPRCHRALDKSWVFADPGHDRVEATLHSCRSDGIYFLSRDRHDHGPFHPFDEEKHR